MSRLPMTVVRCPGPGSGKMVLLRSWIGQAGAAGLSKRVARVPAGPPPGRTPERRHLPAWCLYLMQAGDSRLVLAARPACRPGTDALAGQHPLGHGDLLCLGGLVGRRGVLAAAIAKPGLLGELQPTVEAVAGAGAPVSAGLTRRDGRPVRPARGCWGRSRDRRGSGRTRLSDAHRRW